MSAGLEGLGPCQAAMLVVWRATTTILCVKLASQTTCRPRGVQGAPSWPRAAPARAAARAGSRLSPQRPAGAGAPPAEAGRDRSAAASGEGGRGAAARSSVGGSGIAVRDTCSGSIAACTAGPGAADGCGGGRRAVARSAVEGGSRTAAGTLRSRGRLRPAAAGRRRAALRRRRCAPALGGCRPARRGWSPSSPARHTLPGHP